MTAAADIDQEQVAAFLATHGATTERDMKANAWWRMKVYLREKLGATLAATTTRAHFTLNDGPPRSLARVVDDANAEARRRGDPLFDLAEIEAAWLKIRARGR